MAAMLKTIAHLENSVKILHQQNLHLRELLAKYEASYNEAATAATANYIQAAAAASAEHPYALDYASAQAFVAAADYGGLNPQMASPVSLNGMNGYAMSPSSYVPTTADVSPRQEDGGVSMLPEGYQDQQYLSHGTLPSFSSFGSYEDQQRYPVVGISDQTSFIPVSLEDGRR